jgi:hypothetical protein
MSASFFNRNLRGKTDNKADTPSEGAQAIEYPLIMSRNPGALAVANRSRLEP